MTGPAAVTFRPYRPGDETAINDGFNRAFGASRSLDEWRWKYGDAPEGRWIMLAFEAGGRLVAHYGAVPVRLRVGELTVRAAQPTDSFSLPAGRHGLGAANTFQRTVAEFFSAFGGPERLAVLFGFPGERHRRLGVARLGYEQLPPQPVVVWRRPAARRRRFSAHTVRSGADARRADALWARARRRYPIAVVRDAAWLERRYAGRPGVEYVHLVASLWGRPAALAVVRTGAPTLQWAELVWDGRSARALAALDGAVDEIARSSGATSVEMWLSGDPDAEAWLTANGWERASHPAGLALVARSFHPAIDVASFAGVVYLTMGDSDLV